MAATSAAPTARTLHPVQRHMNTICITYSAWYWRMSARTRCTCGQQMVRALLEVVVKRDGYSQLPTRRVCDVRHVHWQSRCQLSSLNRCLGEEEEEGLEDKEGDDHFDNLAAALPGGSELVEHGTTAAPCSALPALQPHHLDQKPWLDRHGASSAPCPLSCCPLSPRPRQRCETLESRVARLGQKARTKPRVRRGLRRNA